MSTPYIELGRRINKYLKENKEQKIIDIKKLISTLRTDYPEKYGKTKKEDFETQVDQAFKELAGQAAGKRMKEKKKEKGKKEEEKGKGKKGKKKGDDYYYCGGYYYGYYYNYYNYYNNYYYSYY